MKVNPWAQLLAYVTGLINQELLLKNEYLTPENRILRAHVPARLRLSDPERSTLAEIGKRLGRKALAQLACVAKPDTILAWYRKLIARKFDGSKHRRYPGRPPPCRVLDTRNADGTFGEPAITSGGIRSFPIPSSGCGAPSTSAAYLFNVTVVPHGSLGYLTVWPEGQIQPAVSTLNSIDGSVVANAAIVMAGTGGALNFFATDTTDLVVDINGYFGTPGDSFAQFLREKTCYGLAPWRRLEDHMLRRAAADER